MSDQLRVFAQKIKTLGSLKSIIKTMKIFAAINIVSYEKSVAAIFQYYQSLKLGLTACLIHSPQILFPVEGKKPEIKKTGVVVFGSDQGMVGNFNDEIAAYARRELALLTSEKIIWPVGECVNARLLEYPDLNVKNPLSVPASQASVSSLISELLDDFDRERAVAEIDQLLIFYNRPLFGALYEPTCLSLLPIAKEPNLTWPTNKFPEIVDGLEATLSLLIRQHLFTSIVKACIESMCSENAYRLAAMQVAEKHIDEQLEREHFNYNQERQNRIDEELSDIISGFEVITSSLGKL